MNRGSHFEYVNELGLDSPTDEIMEVLSYIGRRSGKDTLTAARFFLRKYREGKFGLFLLDELQSTVCKKQDMITQSQ